MIKMKKILLIVAFMATSISIAQTAYVDTDFIINKLPEVQKADKELTNLATSLQEGITKAEANANQRYKTLQYEAQSPTLTDEERQNLVKQAEELQTELNRVKLTAEQTISKKRNEIMTPIYDRINATIAKIAREKGYKMVVSVGTVMFAEEELDITTAVLTALGVTAE
jgi:outer membrane protein